MRARHVGFGMAAMTAFGIAWLSLSGHAEAGRAKIDLCHVPPGDPGNARTITISETAVPAHLAHGDTVGGCPDGCLVDQASCDDENFCTDDVCLSDGQCAHLTVDCDDGNVCTSDACDVTIGCLNLPVDGPCDDGNACSAGDSCVGGLCLGSALPGCCQADADCDDGAPCTADVCDDDNTCQNDPLDCSQWSDACSVGFCDPVYAACGAAPVDCDDGNVCTDDLCDPFLGCASVPTSNPPEEAEQSCDDQVDNDCDALLDCWDPDCVAAGACIFCGGIGALPCPSGSACNPIDPPELSDTVGVCVPDPCASDAECDDGDFCTNDFCDADGGCVSVPLSSPPQSVETSCSDGTDNDCDGYPDCWDSDCATTPACPGGEEGDPCGSIAGLPCDPGLQCFVEDSNVSDDIGVCVALFESASGG